MVRVVVSATMGEAAGRSTSRSFISIFLLVVALLWGFTVAGFVALFWPGSLATRHRRIPQS
jgi:hypothetical protein